MFNYKRREEHYVILVLNMLRTESKRLTLSGRYLLYRRIASSPSRLNLNVIVVFFNVVHEGTARLELNLNTFGIR